MCSANDSKNLKKLSYWWSEGLIRCTTEWFDNRTSKSLNWPSRLIKRSFVLDFWRFIYISRRVFQAFYFKYTLLILFYALITFSFTYFKFLSQEWRRPQVLHQRTSSNFFQILHPTQDFFNLLLYLALRYVCFHSWVPFIHRM